MTHEFSGPEGPQPDQVTRIRQLYAEALETVPDAELEPSSDDLTRLRERLLNKPAGEPEEISTTRQAILDDPEKLRSYFRVFARYDAVLSSIEASDES